jgi:hypothetical protein
MSTPVHDHDGIDELQLYIPSRTRGLSRSSTEAEPPVREPRLTSPESNGEEPRGPVTDEAPQTSPLQWSQATESPPMAPDVRGADGDGRQPEPESASPQTRPAPRLPQGLGGPNIGWRPWPMPPQGSRAGHAAPAGIDGIGIAWPPRSSQRREFEGDTAIKALRHRLSLDPELLPAPPIRRRSSSVAPTLGRLSLVVLVAAMVACGIALLSLPENRLAIVKRDLGAALASLLAGLAVAPSSSPLEASSPAPAPRLVVEGRQTFANEALALGVSLNGATGSEFALLTGLAAGTRLSAGVPFGTNGWQLPARELGRAMAFAPRDFIGVMDTAIDLRLPNDTLVDSQIMRLEWLPKQPEVPKLSSQPDRNGARAAFRPLDAAEVDMLVKRGQDYLKIGDIVSARLVLRRAVGARNAQAALTLGATFDPVVLDQLGVLGFAPDAAQARAWYQRAAELGLTEASRRIERLARLAN